MTRFVLICLGGAAGTGARYLVGVGAGRWLGTVFPWGTLIVNLVGSFLIAVIMELGIRFGAVPAELRVVLTTGVMGGFTTYSSFNYETLALFEQGSVTLAAANVAVTLVACLAAGLGGLALARWAVA